MISERVRLAVAIPTYNFGRFIGETLDSILPQLVADVEVVVVDGGSTDNTAEVVSQRQATYPALRYHQLGAKGGIDRDMAAAVEAARGDYCWLFSADDIMRPGAIQTVREHIDGGSDVILCTHGGATIDLEPLTDTYPALACRETATFQLGDPKQRRRYCASAITTEAFFSFIGTLIVRREKWRSVPIDARYVGTCWAHSARLLSLATSDLKVTYLPQPLLTRRDGNDSFATDGLVSRYALAIDGYHRIADEIFGPDSLESCHIKRTVRNEFGLAAFLRAKASVRSAADKAELDRLARKSLRSGSWRGRLAYGAFRASPRRTYGLARAIVHGARRIAHRSRTAEAPR